MVAPLYVDNFLGRFKNKKKTSNGWEVLCPVHDDQKQSLCISIGDDGLILLKCQAGCATESIVAKVGLAMHDLFPPSEFGRIVATYDYRSADGRLLFQKVRLDPKDFRLRRPVEGGGWTWDIKGVETVLYNLPAIVAAPSDVVWVVEGEKDADNLIRLGLLATTNPGGACKWSDRFSRALEGRTVIILPDNDKSGQRHADEVSRSLHAFDCSIKIVAVPEPHKDISDWLMAGGTKEELLERAGRQKEKREFFQFTQRIDWPDPMGEEAFGGLAGEFVRRIEDQTEADKVAILVQFLVALGSIMGRGPYFQVEKTRHYMNLFCVLVGRTARGRKGTAMGWVDHIFSQVGDTYWSDKRCVHGLSSGEGLIWEVRDPIERVEKGERIVVDEGEPDKRLLVVEQEFASVLLVAGREGNTLSTCIRQAWDTGKLRIMTKHSKAKSSGAHISIIGHVTKAELMKRMKEVEVANGFANRFLWVCVRRSQLLPHGGQEVYLDDLIGSLRDVVDAARRIDRMVRTKDADEFWATVYPELNQEVAGSFGMVTDRAGPQVLRLSCLYAILDGSADIRPEHIRRALAVWTYAHNSARYIFGESTGHTEADDILHALNEAGEEGISRAEISSVVFHHHKSASQISLALNQLRDYGLADSVLKNGRGRPKEIWKVAKYANDAN